MDLQVLPRKAPYLGQHGEPVRRGRRPATPSPAKADLRGEPADRFPPHAAGSRAGSRRCALCRRTSAQADRRRRRVRARGAERRATGADEIPDRLMPDPASRPMTKPDLSHVCARPPARACWKRPPCARGCGELRRPVACAQQQAKGRCGTPAGHPPRRARSRCRPVEPRKARSPRTSLLGPYALACTSGTARTPIPRGSPRTRTWAARTRWRGSRRSGTGWRPCGDARTPSRPWTSICLVLSPEPARRLRSPAAPPRLPSLRRDRQGGGGPLTAPRGRTGALRASWRVRGHGEALRTPCGP